ncbi:cytochrome c biogenesis CcdA family protein [Rothia sp. P7181]|uniref:cytochrome c biogenesis CcdA family protein n=1 Tax=unclassified Rothia (in: high G+C Gram-positive bacteria) TaxID=2689056 RepID=UPI003AC55D15
MVNTFGEIIIDGSLWLAIPLAVLAGLVSFASPCVLPLVPGYIGYMTGLSGNTKNINTRYALGAVALFILGFSTVFILLSVVFAQLGAAPWLRGQRWVEILLGTFVILLGLVFWGKIPWLQRERKLVHSKAPSGLWGAPLLGLTFGLGWAPCIGPTFAAVQTLVYLDGANTAKAITLTFAYCLGLGIPFFIVALGILRGTQRLRWLKQHHRRIQQCGAVLLILIGALMITGVWNSMISWIQATLPTYELPI